MEVKEKRQVFKNYLGYIVAGYTTSYRFEKGKKVYETEFLMPDGSTQKFPLSECDIKDKKELKRGYNMGKNGEYSEGCHVVVPLEGSGALVLGEVESISLEEPKYFIRLNKRKFCMCTQDELDKWNAITANSKRVAICADTNA